MVKSIEDFRIEDIEYANVNGRDSVVFKAFERSGNAFIFVGAFSASINTELEDLWKIAKDRDTL